LCLKVQRGKAGTEEHESKESMTTGAFAKEKKHSLRGRGSFHNAQEENTLVMNVSRVNGAGKRGSFDGEKCN